MSKIGASLEKHEELSIDLILHDKLRDLIEEGIDLQVCVGQVSNSAPISRRIGATTAFLVAAPKYRRVVRRRKSRPIFKSTTALSITGRDETISGGSPPPSAPSQCPYAVGFAPTVRRVADHHAAIGMPDQHDWRVDAGEKGANDVGVALDATQWVGCGDDRITVFLEDCDDTIPTR